MIIGIGCDIVDYNIIKKLNWTSDEKLLSRIFSDKEIEFYHKKKTISYLAGRFAAKESVLKCLGTGMYDGISLKDIEISRLQNGQPTVTLKGKIKNISNKLNVSKWHISISHSLSSSMAFATAES